MRVATDGPIAPAEVWRRYEQLRLWPAWAPQIKSVMRDGEILAPGVAGQVVGPAGLSVNFEILSVDPEHLRWSWKVKRGPVSVVLNHGVDPEGQGSRAWIEINPLFLPYTPLAWYALHRLVTLESV